MISPRVIISLFENPEIKKIKEMQRELVRDESGVLSGVVRRPESQRSTIILKHDHEVTVNLRHRHYGFG